MKICLYCIHLILFTRFLPLFYLYLFILSSLRHGSEHATEYTGTPSWKTLCDEHFDYISGDCYIESSEMKNTF